VEPQPFRVAALSAVGERPLRHHTPPTLVVPDWTLLPSLSDVVVETNRVTVGADYLLRDWVTVFFRYNSFEYADFAGSGNSGTLHALLGGMSAVF
jgi:hypothetical protein